MERMGRLQPVVPCASDALTGKRRGPKGVTYLRQTDTHNIENALKIIEQRIENDSKLLKIIAKH